VLNCSYRLYRDRHSLGLRLGASSSGCVTAMCLQEKRIYDLKKKNQELEKFKFVLDYKIKELKKQIEPREKDIKQMREQIVEVKISHLL